MKRMTLPRRLLVLGHTGAHSHADGDRGCRHRHEPRPGRITEAIGALDVRIFRLERAGTREGESWRRLRAKRGVALALGGDAEVRYPSC